MTDTDVIRTEMAKLDRFKQPRWSRESILEWAQVAI